MSQVGRRGPSRVRLWRGFSQTLCSPGRWSPTLCLSWRGSRSRPLSRSPSLRSPPFLSLRRSPARSRCRSEWRSRSGRGCRSGSRSLGRVRGCRVPDVSSMARCRVPPRSDPRATITSFPSRWPSPGAGRGRAGRSPARTRTGYAAGLRGVRPSALRQQAQLCGPGPKVSPAVHQGQPRPPPAAPVRSKYSLPDPQGERPGKRALSALSTLGLLSQNVPIHSPIQAFTQPHTQAPRRQPSLYLCLPPFLSCYP